MDEYFDKINKKMIKSLDKIENETDNIELEINRQLQYIETYRCVCILLYNILRFFTKSEKNVQFYYRYSTVVGTGYPSN